MLEHISDAFTEYLQPFVWGSSWKPMRRDNLFCSIEAGGLGLTHLFVRQTVSRFMFFRPYSHKFIRTYLQTHLSDLLADLVLSSVHLTMPRPFGFLKEVVAFIQFLKVRFSTKTLVHRFQEGALLHLSRTAIPRTFIPQPISRRSRLRCIQNSAQNECLTNGKIIFL